MKSKIVADFPLQMTIRASIQMGHRKKDNGIQGKLVQDTLSKNSYNHTAGTIMTVVAAVLSLFIFLNTYNYGYVD